MIYVDMDDFMFISLKYIYIYIYIYYDGIIVTLMIYDISYRCDM
jgi:hypothetical protein